MTSVDIFFEYQGEKRNLRFLENTSIQDVLNEYLRITNIATSLNANQITFLYRNLILNKNDNLNKSLRDLNIRSRSFIKVINKSGIEAAGGP